MKREYGEAQSLLKMGLPLMAAGLLTLLPAQSRAQNEGPERHPRAVAARRLTVTGRGEVKIAPDKADITLGVVTEDRSSKTAALTNAATSQKVQDALRQQGVAKSDIQTVRYSVEPIYSPPPIRPDTAPRPSVITGYRVTNQVRITVHEIARLGGVLDAATAVGSNTIESIAFGKSEQKAFEDEALSKAVTDARHKADLMARTAGAKIVGIYEMNEGNVQRPGPVLYSRASLAATPINPGEETISADVTIVYEMADSTLPPK